MYSSSDHWLTSKSVSGHLTISSWQYMMLICQVSWNAVSDVFISQVSFLFCFFGAVIGVFVIPYCPAPVVVHASFVTVSLFVSKNKWMNEWKRDVNWPASDTALPRSVRLTKSTATAAGPGISAGTLWQSTHNSVSTVYMSWYSTQYSMSHDTVQCQYSIIITHYRSYRGRFYGSDDPTNSVKHWRTTVGQSTRSRANVTRPSPLQAKVK